MIGCLGLSRECFYCTNGKAVFGPYRDPCVTVFASHEATSIFPVLSNNAQLEDISRLDRGQLSNFSSINRRLLTDYFRLFLPDGDCSAPHRISLCAHRKELTASATLITPETMVHAYTVFNRKDGRLSLQPRRFEMEDDAWLKDQLPEAEEFE